MAGAFYSIEEVIEKIGKTEDQIKELVKDGKLREFRDGAKLFYKTKEVDAMSSEAGSVSPPEPIVELSLDGTGQVTLEPGGTGQVSLEPDETEQIVPEQDETEQVAPEQNETEQVTLEADGTGQVALEPDGTASDDDSIMLEETTVEETTVEGEKEDEKDKTAAHGDLSDIAELTDLDSDLGEMTKADTGMTSIGINVLAETDDGYKLTDDTLGETNLAESTEELSSLGDDLNLDTAGSGSGLLDLSLQADDTSLGAVLDDILPAADQEPPPGGGIGSGQQDEGEVDKIFDQPEEEVDVPQSYEPVSAVRYVAAVPDAVGNACGIAMFLPLIALIYAAVVVVATFKGIIPAALTSIEGIIWYIAGGMAFVTVAIIGIAAMMGDKKPAGKKQNVYQQANQEE